MQKVIKTQTLQCKFFLFYFASVDKFLPNSISKLVSQVLNPTSLILQSLSLYLIVWTLLDWTMQCHDYINVITLLGSCSYVHQPSYTTFTNTCTTTRLLLSLLDHLWSNISTFLTAGHLSTYWPFVITMVTMGGGWHGLGQKSLRFNLAGTTMGFAAKKLS